MKFNLGVLILPLVLLLSGAFLDRIGRPLNQLK